MGVFSLIANVAVSKSRHRLFFYPKRKGEKAQERPLILFLEFGGGGWQIMKREGISTLFIHGFPWALSYFLDHFLLFECALSF